MQALKKIHCSHSLSQLLLISACRLALLTSRRPLVQGIGDMEAPVVIQSSEPPESPHHSCNKYCENNGLQLTISKLIQK